MSYPQAKFLCLFAFQILGFTVTANSRCYLALQVSAGSLLDFPSKSFETIDIEKKDVC